MASAKKTAAARKKKKKPYPHVDIDIPHVTSRTKVSALTTGQLVELLVQVHYQLPIQRGRPSPQMINEAIQRVHDLIMSPDDAFRQTQAAIIKEMPNIVGGGPWAPKDGGAAPHATRRTPPKPPKPPR
jgi:hypothetical protein